MLNNVSHQVLEAVYARLSSISSGYNVGIAAQAVTYGIDPISLLLDFSSTSQNFYFDQIDAESMEKTGTIKYPFGCLYILDSMQTNEQKFTQFSGVIRCVFEVNISWVPVRGTQNREIYSNCLEDVVLDVINRTPNQLWGKPLVYNGNIQCRRGATQFGGQNFRKLVAFPMLFGLHQ